jgi:histidinol-phosphate aminotransferase
MTTTLKLDQNERSEGLPAWASRAWAELDQQAVWGYPRREPTERLLALTLGLKPEQVLLGNGSDELIATLFASLPPGSPVLLPAPTFGFYGEQLALWPLEGRQIPPTANFDQDWSAVEAALAEQQGGLLVLVRPNNPTGEVLPRQHLLSLLKLAQTRGALVLLDEAYAEFSGESLLSEAQFHPHVLISRTFSKAYGLAGLRLGYFVGAAPLIASLRRRTMPFNVSHPGLQLVQAALSPAARQEVAEYSAAVAANRDQLLGLLNSWGVPAKPSGANFLMFRLTPQRADFVRAATARLGLYLRAWADPAWAGVLRLSIPACLGDLPERLERVFKPRLLCLDVDGCLIDTSESFDAAIAATVELFGGARPARTEILALRGRSGFNDDHQLTLALLAERGLRPPFSHIQRVFNDFYFGAGQSAGLVTLEKPLISMHFWARLQNRCRLALVTGRNRREMAHALDVLFPSPDVLSITLDDVERGKPDPQGILQAMAAFQTGNAWMIGDNVDDIRAASAAGALPLGVGPNREALLQAGALAVLATIDELEVLL